MHMHARFFQKYYTRIIGVAFLLVVISLIADYLQLGYRAETWHKIFHVVVGGFVVAYGWKNQKFWKPFCLVNGGFFLLVAGFGWMFPDFYGLDAFNFVDTILHSLVGVSGLVIGMLKN